MGFCTVYFKKKHEGLENYIFVIQAILQFTHIQISDISCEYLLCAQAVATE